MVIPRFLSLKKLSSRLIATLLLVVFLSIFGMGLTAYMTQRVTLYDNTFNHLETVIATKSTSIQQWLNERTNDIEFLAINRLNQQYLTELAVSTDTNRLKEESGIALRENLLSLQQTQPYYKQIDIANADGIIVISTSDAATYINQETFLKTIRNSGNVYIRKTYIDSDKNRLYMQFAHVMNELNSITGNETDSVIGLAVITVDVEELFSRTLDNHQFLGETSDLILGRKKDGETVILTTKQVAEENDYSFSQIAQNPDSPHPIERAINGERGIIEVDNADGNPILYAYSPLPQMGWGLAASMKREEMMAPIWPLLKWLSIVSLLLFAFAAFFAIRLWYRIAQPISYLARAITSVTEGDLAVDVQIMNDDEIGTLAESFSEMLVSLRRRRIDLHYVTKAVEITEQENTQLVMQLRQLNSDLEHIVYDRTEKLSVANNKLKLLDELKSKFISNVSHELRNPVASLKLYVNLLNKSNDSNRERYLDAIGRQIDILTHLVENVLDISHLENDNMTIMLSPCDVNLIAERIVESNRPRAEAAGLTLTLQKPEEQTVVLGSASKLMQLISNLVTNALNYTSIGFVSIEIKLSDHNVLIIVEDTGMGIPKDDMPHLFERFYRGHNVNELEIRGTGLGLGIVKEVVDLHNGTIVVESEEGEGTKFQISIPLSVETVMAQEQFMEW